MQRVLLAIIVLGGLFTFYLMIMTTPRSASLVLVNGTVYTLDRTGRITEAIAINGNTIVEAGSTNDIMSQFPGAKVIDLAGKTVVPGLTDAHAHLLGEGNRLSTLDLSGTRSLEQISALLLEWTRQTQPGEWIIGRGWDQNDWAEKMFPDKSFLDRVASDRPVMLSRVDGHAVWVNSNVLELAEITRDTPDPDGGKIVRNPDGSPTGILIDNAIDIVQRVLPELSDSEIERRLALALEECARLGLTSVHDMGMDMQTVEAFKRLVDRGECPIRVYGAIGGPGKTWDAFRASGPLIGYGDGRFSVRAIKLYADGALGSRGAALFEEYSDDPGNRGLTIMSEQDIALVCQQALDAGFQVCTHAIGDRGNRMTLDQYEKVLASRISLESSPRWRIEHAQVLAPEDIPRFFKLKILPSMQPTHATSDMYWAEARLGKSRVNGAYCWQSLLTTGSMILNGSDFPVEGVNPLWGFYAAISRSDRNGYPQDGWMPAQKMTREQAIRSFTLWASYGAFQENLVGSIEKGKRADMTILSKDIMKIEPSEILSTVVDLTIVDGEIVYRRDQPIP